MIENNVKVCYNNKNNVENMGRYAMHRIVGNYLKKFVDDQMLASEKEDKAFEMFVNYNVAYLMYPSTFDPRDITSDDEDGGIDGIIFLIDGELITTSEEASNVFSKPKKNIEVEVCFVQSKTSENFDRGEILKFGDGVFDFLQEKSNLPFCDFILNCKKIFDIIIDNVSKIQGGRPVARLLYVCTSGNGIATEIEATRLNIEKKITNTEFFSKVSFELYGLKDIMKMWDNVNNTSSATLPVKACIAYPQMEGVTESYIAVVSVKDYIENILKNQEGRMRFNIFEENVRAFLGIDNPVNEKIKHTLLNAEKSDKFAIYNNGITIISPDVRYQSNQISMENFQIVNGCQTSNVLYDCRNEAIEGATITIKIIEADDPDVIADIVRATNNQSKVDDSQFLSFSPFVRRLEKYFYSTEDIEGKEVKLYFERRNGQYKNTDIPKKRIFSISETCRALGSLFMLVPDMASRYPTKFLSQMSDKLFNEQNKEEAYYSASLLDYKFKQFSSRGKLLKEYVIYKWHILTIFGFIATGKNPPSLKNKKEISKYCKLINQICMSDEKCVEVFQKTVDVIEEIGRKSNRDEVRSTSYANEVKKYCYNKLIKND